MTRRFTVVTGSQQGDGHETLIILKTKRLPKLVIKKGYFVGDFSGIGLHRFLILMLPTRSSAEQPASSIFGRANSITGTAQIGRIPSPHSHDRGEVISPLSSTASVLTYLD
jgi:hypothetical protein